MKADKAFSPVSIQIASILGTATKGMNSVFKRLRDLVEPLSLEEAEAAARDARKQWRNAGYDRKRDGQSHADTLLSLLLRAKRDLGSVPESQAECRAALAALKPGNASGKIEGDDEAAEQAAAEKAKDEGRRRMGEGLEKFAEAVEIQPQDVLALAKLALEMRDIITAAGDAMNAGVARVTILAALRTMMRDQQRANAEADSDTAEETAALLESEAA